MSHTHSFFARYFYQYVAICDALYRQSNDFRDEILTACALQTGERPTETERKAHYRADLTTAILAHFANDPEHIPDILERFYRVALPENKNLTTTDLQEKIKDQFAEIRQEYRSALSEIGGSPTADFRRMTNATDGAEPLKSALGSAQLALLSMLHKAQKDFEATTHIPAHQKPSHTLEHRHIVMTQWMKSERIAILPEEHILRELKQASTPRSALQILKLRMQ